MPIKRHSNSDPQDRPADWTPDQALRSDATDEQIFARVCHHWVKIEQEPEALAAREFAAASLAARVPADWREDKQVTNARSTLIRDATYAHVPDAYQMAALLALPLDALCDAVAACATQQEEKR